jgi:hypothetical protein
MLFLKIRYSILYYGLWNYDQIRFSKYGNLNQTIIQLINQSKSGMLADEIGQLIAYRPHSLCDK